MTDGPLNLPEGAFSMSLMLTLEPPALRKLLKAGLRGGLSEEQLQTHLQDFPETERSVVLRQLQERGWLVQKDDRWVTASGH
jgi:hypothetical protein